MVQWEQQQQGAPWAQEVAHSLVPSGQLVAHTLAPLVLHTLVLLEQLEQPVAHLWDQLGAVHTLDPPVHIQRDQWAQVQGLVVCSLEQLEAPMLELLEVRPTPEQLEAHTLAQSVAPMLEVRWLEQLEAHRTREQLEVPTLEQRAAHTPEQVAHTLHLLARTWPPLALPDHTQQLLELLVHTRALIPHQAAHTPGQLEAPSLQQPAPHILE